MTGLPATESIDSASSIKVNGLSKTYRVWESPWHRLKHLLLANLKRISGQRNPIRERLDRWTGTGFRDVKALAKVSFEIGRGEVVGIIGYNGSGKSTLLQILAGTLTPTSGEVEVNGRVAALLELGSGFNPDFSGRENAYLYGALLGFSREYLKQHMHAIEEFAEIGEFIDEPVKTYSTGMVTRLAFAVLTQLDPDILIVDEALSVGDAYFQHKSINLIRQFQQAGKTMLIVSHSPGTIKSMCTRAIILERGVLIREGPAASVCDYYNALVAKKQKDAEIRQVERHKGGPVITRSGDRRVVIGDVELVAESGAPARTFTVGETARIACALEVRSEVHNPTVGMLLRDRLGSDVFGSNTHYQKTEVGTLEAGRRCEIVFTFPMNLAPGRYSITVAAHSGRDHLSDNYDWQDNVIVFEVLPGLEATFTGTAWLNLEVEVNRDKVSLLRPYAWGNALNFGADGESIRHKQQGWSATEDQHTWTDGPEAVLRFDLPSSETDRSLRFRVGGFCTPETPRQRVSILFDDAFIAELEISEIYEHIIRIPSRMLAKSGRHIVKFALPDATAPAAMGISDDSRLLALQFFELSIV
ncbi:ABC transporter ATP-binding protein [Synoicihabitans lomoniglobus]|uniref:ABC transporter ATP-binding protein n=1 Tax=Synoicihabitans lomoniglobus TaxID=2909285 RepID=A0AAF0CSS1_9BACT|nr:ABC transporter ATP-binding protein [Opitutaceae bacterium LMO-M01]WED67375.1 ABC transporter ATP-binding protein [Opitutaceae bacterium LMO-M01]